MPRTQQVVQKSADSKSESDEMREEMSALQRRLDSLRAEVRTGGAASSGAASTQSVAYLEKENFDLIVENGKATERIAELEEALTAAGKRRRSSTSSRRSSTRKASASSSSRSAAHASARALGERSPNVRR